MQQNLPHRDRGAGQRRSLEAGLCQPLGKRLKLYQPYGLCLPAV